MCFLSSVSDPLGLNDIHSLTPTQLQTHVSRSLRATGIRFVLRAQPTAGPLPPGSSIGSALSTPAAALEVPSQACVPMCRAACRQPVALLCRTACAEQVLEFSLPPCPIAPTSQVLEADISSSSGGGRGEGDVARSSGNVGSRSPPPAPPTANVCASHACRVSVCIYLCACVRRALACACACCCSACIISYP